MKFIKLFIITLLFSSINTFAQSAVGMTIKGHNYFNKGNYSEAVDCFRKAAEQGLAEGQYNLGMCYGKGQGVPRNFDEALKWIRKAAAQDYQPAKDFLRAIED